MAGSAVSQKSKEWTAFTAEVKTQAGLLFGFVALFWAVFAVDTVLGGALRPLGIHPRTTQGLWGILAAPLLHGGLFHIVPNTVGFLALGWLVMLRDTRHFVLVTLAGVVVGGMTAWLLGSAGSVHIGASGVVFAFFGFVLMGGWFSRSLGSVLLSVVVAVAWGGMVFGVLPGQPGISWEAHLGGFLGGVSSAWLVARANSRTLARA